MNDQTGNPSANIIPTVSAFEANCAEGGIAQKGVAK